METNLKMELFENFDFSLLESPDFKEDSVRETLITPLLNALGYSATYPKSRIIRSKMLTHPFVTVGANSRRQIKSVPDYLLETDGKYQWVLDAKAPTENITGGDNLEQVYFYAIHPEVRVKYYALCNGREFALFQIESQEPILHFHLSEIEKHWKKLLETLGDRAFQKTISIQAQQTQQNTFDYMAIKPLGEIKNLEKQSAKRHYGVHGYFTKQVWNVVQAYIKNFTQPGDIVLDPFGGSGVTAIESLILARKAIHIDINPLSVFIVKNLISRVNPTKVNDAYRIIRKTFAANAPETDKQIEDALAKYPYPKNVTLPRNADVETVAQLFSRKQLAQLAYLKYLILQVQDSEIQGTLLLMFSGLLNQINLTYHASGNRAAGRGDSAMFRYYRYRIAPNPSNLEILARLELRFKRVMSAKKEIYPLITEDRILTSQVLQGSATNMVTIDDASIDYIYTDPPYGSKIAYLDLSTMWNAWLDLPVTEAELRDEVIEGGEQQKTSKAYSDLLSQSIREMYRVLKFDRWMSFVFAHKDPKFWHLIVDTAESVGFEYAGAVKQSNGKTTYKKRQNPFNVIEGQLIINFKKVQNPKSILRVELGADIADIVVETIEAVIANNDGATLEEINDELIIRGLELGFLDVLSREYQDISPFLRDNFDYSETTRKFHIRQNTKFRSRIDVRLRIRYYLISLLRRKELKGEFPTTDEIVWAIMPLLKNGKTPENQTILSVLEEVASQHGDNRWRLVNTHIPMTLL